MTSTAFTMSVNKLLSRLPATPATAMYIHPSAIYPPRQGQTAALTVYNNHCVDGEEHQGSKSPPVIALKPVLCLSFGDDA